MGTLGCINDMQRRDRENWELRRAGHERMKETRRKMLNVKKSLDHPQLTVEEWNAIDSSLSKESASRKKRQFWMKIGLLATCSAIVLGLIYLFVLS